MSHAELQSNFRASISLASETEVFLAHLDGHTYSPEFISGHLAYLEKQGSDIQHDLVNASVQRPDIPSLTELRNATRDLTQTLNDLRSHVPDPPLQTSSIAHLDSIRQRLQADTPR
jgi:hypothetical protein